MISKLATGLLRRGKESLENATGSLDRGNLAAATSEAQFAVELAVKAALRAVGVDPPQDHDISHFLLARRSKFPADLRSTIPEWADAMRELSERRSMANYGDPRSDRAPSDVFSDPAETRQLVGRAENVYGAVYGFFASQIREKYRNQGASHHGRDRGPAVPSSTARHPPGNRSKRVRRPRG